MCEPIQDLPQPVTPLIIASSKVLSGDSFGGAVFLTITAGYGKLGLYESYIDQGCEGYGTRA